jgi:DNA-binding beta-propeller fold protein YncE
MSEIFQIDYLANGKLQYLFSTKTKLFVVDRNGVNLEGFPLIFPAKATNGVSVFDYDNNRIYRFFVACDDKKVYAFDKSGKILSGWVFDGTKSEVTTPIQHFRVKGKDYIVFKDSYRIYIQNRKGEPVAKTAAEFENSRNPLVLNSGKNPEIIATDTKGTIYAIDFDGNYTEKKVGKFDDEHFFTADDLNGDNKLEYVFVDGKELSIIDENGTVLFVQKFQNTIQNQPYIYYFGPKLKKIGIVDAKDNRIYLIDSTGKSHPGFPLQGATDFSIGKTTQSAKNLSMIVGSKSGSVVCFGLD